MKSRICLVLLSLTLMLPLCGCQESTAKTDSQSIPAAKETSQKKSKKSTKPAQPKNVSKLSWSENCFVEDATIAAAWVLEELNLGSSRSSGTRTVRTQDPKTGRIVTKQVPVTRGGTGPVHTRNDRLSGIVSAKSTAKTEYVINVSLIPPESCRIEIVATGPNPTDILKKHNKYIKGKISEAIENPVQEQDVTAEPLPYPETMIFERTVNDVYRVIYNWARAEKFDQDSGRGDDKYYRYIECKSDSKIRFIFRIRLIDENKTKLEMKVTDYEDKDEFNVILKSLLEALQELKEDQLEPKTATTYTETKLLDNPISAVYDALVSWAKNNGFNIGRNTGGDAFYKYLYCHTTSGIDFSFDLRLIDVDITKLKMTVGDQRDKEEFPMILKSLEAALEKIGTRETVVENVGKAVKAQPQKANPKNCQEDQYP